MQNGSAVGIRATHCMHVFARLGADLYAQSVIINKISASELSRMFIKSALSVGHVVWVDVVGTYYVRTMGGKKEVVELTTPFMSRPKRSQNGLHTLG